MNAKVSAESVLKLVLIASIISTAIHFTDNYRFIEDYPQPTWITAPSISARDDFSYQSEPGYWDEDTGWFAIAIDFVKIVLYFVNR
ncbi:MAG: hypothetical protein F6K32_25845 [Desertifilum sp. SIO1I2]|nr:hypothetical protein [Desertifilum sp. SIO1I2]